MAPTPLYSIEPEEPDGFNDKYVTLPDIRLYSDENGTIEYKIDGGDPIVAPDEVILTGQEGFNNISFRAWDDTNHVSEWLQFNFTVDSTPPSIWTDTDPIVPDGLNGWFITPPTVSLNSSETLSIAYYRINNGIESLYEGPIQNLHGITRISFRGFDLAGNQNTTEVIISVDTILPYSTLNVSHSPDGENGYYVTIPAIVLKSFDTNGANIQYKWDNGSWNDYEVPLYPSKGVHRLEYRAIDNSGNFESTVNFQWFKFDPDPPILNFTIDPPEPDGKNKVYITRPTIELSVDPSEISDHTIRYFIAEMDQGFSWNEDSLPYYAPITIPEGKWRLHMMVKDEAGNQYFPMPVELEIDLTRPEIEWNVTPVEPDGDNMWFVNPPVVTIINITDEAMGYFRLDDNMTWMSISDELPLPPGEHTLYIMVEDEAGNTGDGGSFSYKFDDMDPVAVIWTERLTYYLDEKVNISAGSSMDNIGGLIYRFETDDGRSSLWMDTPDWDFMFNETGNYNLSVVVKDSAGRINRSRNITITMIERPIPPPPIMDLVIEPFDPNPPTDKGWTDAGIEERRFVRGGIILILLLVITILLILVVRKVRIKEVEWEDEDDWMNEDWVDIDLDEIPVEEEDVLIFE
jgi:hypothetical protein